MFRKDIPFDIEFPDLHKAVGRIGEEYALAQIEGPKETEKPVTAGINGVLISGRIDCKTSDCIYEFKTSISRTKFKDIREAKLDIHHLGQCVTYMAIEGVVKGCVVHNYVHFDKALTGLQFRSRWYNIEIRDDEFVYVDGNKQEPVRYYLRFYVTIRDAHNSDSLPPMTMNENACKYCLLLDLCALGAKDKETFRRQVQQLTPPPASDYTPKIEVHDTRDKAHNYGLTRK